MLMDESEKWPKLKWYLAGQYVEAPHSSTGYRRTDGGHGDPHNAAKYYYSGIGLNTPAVSLHRDVAEIRNIPIC